MREDDDQVRHYVPLLRRIIIVVAVLTAVPVALWTVTAFVRSYVGPPKLPDFSPACDQRSRAARQHRRDQRWRRSVVWRTVTAFVSAHAAAPQIPSLRRTHGNARRQLQRRRRDGAATLPAAEHAQPSAPSPDNSRSKGNRDGCPRRHAARQRSCRPMSQHAGEHGENDDASPASHDAATVSADARLTQMRADTAAPNALAAPAAAECGAADQRAVAACTAADATQPARTAESDRANRGRR